MANYQLGPVIGKIGGAEVQKIPVNIDADGGDGSEVVMHTVHVSEGETWLIVLSGDLSPYRMSSSGPRLFIGDVSIGPGLPAGRTVLVVEVTGTAEIGLRRNTSSGSDRFDGHIYAAPLP